MGNSDGNFQERLDMIEVAQIHAGRLYMGLGSIKASEEKSKDGKEYWAYGGDFGDKPNERQLRLQRSYRTRPHSSIPLSTKSKKFIQYIKTVPAGLEAGKIQIRKQIIFSAIFPSSMRSGN